jgi:hypothetical protein
VITPADVVGEVEVEPEMTERVANTVIVIGERTQGAPLVAIRRNTDPASPVSTVSLGREVVYGGGPITIDADTQAAVDAYADDLFELAGTYYRTVIVRLLPGRLPGLQEVVELRDFVNAGVDLSGRYWLKSWRIGVTPDDALLELSLSALTVVQ